MTGFSKLSAIVAFFVIISILDLPTYTSGTLHAKKCDDRCGGSRLNPFGASDTCSQCCNSHGFSRGGECGDFLSRHCRCWENPPVLPGGQPQYPQQPYPGGQQQPYPGYGG